MVGVVRQKPVNKPHPYMVEVYVAVEGSEACLALNQVKAFCTRGGVVRKARLELEFARLEPHEGKMCTAPRACWRLPRRWGNT